jgi:hypothetical protein
LENPNDGTKVYHLENPNDSTEGNHLKNPDDGTERNRPLQKEKWPKRKNGSSTKREAKENQSEAKNRVPYIMEEKN